jgi:WD40 repeat protein
VVWDVDGGGQVSEARAHELASHALAVSPDGRLAASAGSDASVVLVDLATGGVVRAWRRLSSLPLALAFAPDGKSILSGEREGGLRTFEL